MLLCIIAKIILCAKYFFKMDVLTLDTIDFSSTLDKLQIHELATKISNICEFGNGFFYLRPPAHQEIVIQAIVNDAKQFFDLPKNEKFNLANDESCCYKIKGQLIQGTGSGYRGKGCDPNFKFDTRESFNICSEAFDAIEKTGCGRNKWPDGNLLPLNWKERIVSYTDVMLDLALKMRSIIGWSKHIIEQYSVAQYRFARPSKHFE